MPPRCSGGAARRGGARGRGDHQANVQVSCVDSASVRRPLNHRQREAGLFRTAGRQLLQDRLSVHVQPGPALHGPAFPQPGRHRSQRALGRAPEQQPAQWLRQRPDQPMDGVPAELRKTVAAAAVSASDLSRWSTHRHLARQPLTRPRAGGSGAPVCPPFRASTRARASSARRRGPETGRRPTASTRAWSRSSCSAASPPPVAWPRLPRGPAAGRRR